MMYFADAAGWEAWLAEHHDDEGGAWLKIAKKRSPAISVTITEALDVALCYGWIDSQRKSHDEDFFLQRYAAYAAQRDATVPPDLAAALAAHPQAAARFEALDKTARYLIILPLLKARTEAGRAARLRKTISDLLV